MVLQIWKSSHHYVSFRTLFKVDALSLADALLWLVLVLTPSNCHQSEPNKEESIPVSVDLPSTPGPKLGAFPSCG